VFISCPLMAKSKKSYKTSFSFTLLRLRGGKFALLLTSSTLAGLVCGQYF
jgi:hypothetical protein